MRYLLLLLLVGCETPYNKDDLTLVIETKASIKDGECHIIVNGVGTEHEVSDEGSVKLIEVLDAVPGVPGK